MTIRATMALLVFLGLAACQGGEAFDYTPPDEIPPGPGLFTGDDGAWKIEIPY